MTETKGTGSKERFLIRLAGLKPGTSPDEMAAAVKKLMPRLSQEKIRQALDRLPLTLTRSATKAQAVKVKRFLESKGAVLKISYAAKAVRPPPQPEAPKPEKEPSAPPPPEATEPEAPQKQPGGADRRAKPRVHPGIQPHPMGLGEILDRSFRLLRQYFWIFFLIILIPQGLYFLVNKCALVISTGRFTPGTPAGMAVGFSIYLFSSFIIFIVFQFWAQGALIYAVSETYLGHRTSIRIAYGALRGRLGRLLGTLILMWILIGLLPGLSGVLPALILPKLGQSSPFIGLFVAVALVVSIIIAINLLLNWLMVDKVVVLEDMAWITSLRRSKELMKARTEKGFWKKTKMKASLLLLAGLVIGIAIHLAIQIPGVIFGAIIRGNLIILTIQEILNIAATSLATVYTAIAMILFYYDIRVRKEGFDLKMMAQNL